ncbi:MAG: hypothetical protein ACOC1O_02725 [bacterium]
MIIKYIIIFLIGVFIGYNIGKIYGNFQGRKELLQAMPLIIKEKSFIKGYCIICEKGYKNSNIE